MSNRGNRLTRLATLGRQLRVPVLIGILISGVVLTLLAARQAQQTEQNVGALRFENDAEDSLTAISHTLEQSLDQVRTLGSFLRTTRHVDHQQFAAFAQPMLRRHPTLASLAWAPRVRLEDRGRFVKALQAATDPSFHIIERDSADRPTSASHDACYPITFLKPRASTGLRRGLDLAADPARRAAIARAAASGRLMLAPAVSPPMSKQDRDRSNPASNVQPRHHDQGSPPAQTAAASPPPDERAVGPNGQLVRNPSEVRRDLLSQPPRGMTFLALRPIYRGGQPAAGQRTPTSDRSNLLGFAVGRIRVNDVMERSLRFWNQPHLQVHLLDMSRADHPRLLYVRYGHLTAERKLKQLTTIAQTDEARTGGTGQRAGEQSLVKMQTLHMGGRRWLLVATPTAGYLPSRSAHRPMWILLIGMALTLLVSAILGGLIFYTDRMETFAMDRESVNEQLHRRIAERRDAEEALAAANAELRDVNTDMERFVGAVSHDLKSPLVAAEMLVSVLEQAVKKGDREKTRRTAGQIAHACRRMRRIIDDLLEHQRAGFSHMNTTEVDLCEVALSVVEEHRETATEQHAHVNIDHRLPTLRGDRGRLTAMLDNLVSNALKYGRPVDCDVEPRVEVGCRFTDDQLKLFVRDNGPGIPEAQQGRIWELFQRLAGDDEGTGIGLAIVQRVAQAHGGRAWIECAPPTKCDEPSNGDGDGDGESEGKGIGGGTTFWISLPRQRLVEPPI